MEIDVRWIAPELTEVTVRVDGHSLNVGILDKGEREELIDDLYVAIYELND